MIEQDKDLEDVAPIELTDELYNELVAKYRKVAVFEIDSDNYVFRYPSPIEYKALTSMISKTQDPNKVAEIAKREVSALIVWPEIDVIKDRVEVDGGLEDILVSRFISHYFNRGNAEAQKKR